MSLPPRALIQYQNSSSNSTSVAEITESDTSLPLALTSGLGASRLRNSADEITVSFSSRKMVPPTV